MRIVGMENAMHRIATIQQQMSRFEGGRQGSSGNLQTHSNTANKSEPPNTTIIENMARETNSATVRDPYREPATARKFSPQASSSSSHSMRRHSTPSIPTVPTVPNKKHINHQVLQSITDKAQSNGVSPELISAMVQVESNGRQNAVSPAGAIGLMQLMPATAQELRVNPYNPEENLQGGIDYVKKMAVRYQDLDLALAAYNAGPNAVDRYQGVPPYEETQNYIQKIRNILKRGDYASDSTASTADYRTEERSTPAPTQPQPQPQHIEAARKRFSTRI